MKYFVAIVLIAAAASAGVIKRTQVSDELAKLQQIVAAIYNPSTDPATAAHLEQMLFETLGVSYPAPIAVGRAIIDYIHLIAATKSTGIINPIQVSGELVKLQQIVATIYSPRTDPATAALLEQMLFETLGIYNPAPIAVGPTTIDSIHPITVRAAIVDSIHPITVRPPIVDSIRPITVRPPIVESIHPITVRPTIVDSIHPISVGPAIVDSIHSIAIGL